MESNATRPGSIMTIFIIIIAIITTITTINGHLVEDLMVDGDEDADGTTTIPGCNVTKAHVIPGMINSTGADLSLGNNVLKKGTICRWIIAENAKFANNLYFHVEKFNLGPNAVLNISDKYDNLITSLSGVQPHGLIFTGIKDSLIVDLFIGDDNIKKIGFKVEFSSNRILQIQTIEQSGSLTLPIGVNKTITDADEFVIKLILSPKIIFNGQLLLSFNAFKVSDATVKIQDILDGQAGGPFNKNNQPTSDLISKGGSITLTFNNLLIKDKDIQNINIFYQVLLPSSTVGYQLINDYNTHEIAMPSLTEVDNQFTSVWILKHDDNSAVFVLGYDNFEFMNDYDTVWVKNGRRNSTTIALINKDNLKDAASSYESLMSSGNIIYVEYSSPNIINDEIKGIPIKATPVSAGGFFRGDEVQIDFKQPKSKGPYVYAFATDSDKQAALESDAQLPCDLDIYDSVKKNILPVRPFLAFSKGQKLPNPTISPSNELTLVFNENCKDSKDGFKGKFVGKKTVADKTALGNSDSYILTDETCLCDQECIWLIPSRKTNDSLTDLKILSLDIANKDTLTLDKLSNDVKTALVLSGDAKIKTVLFPEIHLNSSFKYQLKYKRADDKNCSKTGETILKASFAFESTFECEIQLTLKENQNETIAPPTYPDLYALKDKDYKKQCGWAINQNKSAVNLILISFKDLDISKEHTLTLNSPKNNEVYDSATKLEFISDRIYETQVFIELHAELPADGKVDKNSPLSGKGFNLEATGLTCGGEIDGSKVNSLSSSDFPHAITSSEKCVWIINVPKVNDKMQIINFTLEKGNEGDEANRELVIYDALSIREDRVVLLNESINGTYSSSVDSLIVVLNIKDPSKKSMGIKMNWKTEGCLSFCGNQKRCMLPMWRCNNRTECGDWSDEVNCNTTIPQPPPKPQPAPIVSGGVNGWVIVFLIIPMSIAVGVILTLFGPNVMRRLRGGRYQEFNDFSEVS